MKQHNLFIRIWSTLLITVIFGGCANAQNNAPIVQISKDGKALQQILISSEASDSTKELAQTLADYLHRISGGDFKVNDSEKVLLSTSTGIAIGTIDNFSEVSQQFDSKDPTKTEDYSLRTHANGISVIGATDLGLSHAVWDFLYHLGYRQFFPTENWEIIPQNKNLSLAIDTFQHPSYYARRIWAGGGIQPENAPKWKIWNERNRMVGGISLSTGHSYGAIIRRNKAEFEAHPEYLTKPGGSKFCASNEGLQQLVVDDALKRFDKDPSLQSVSMDPSDGGGWESDSCDDATVYKSVTDRVVTLANLVAENVNKKYPGKYVGMYAYNEHSPAPTIKVHPNVIPSIATSFIRGGFTLEQLLDHWSKQAKQIGIREYYSVFSWHKDLPGRSNGSNLQYLTYSIPHFYEKGARFLSAESGDNWAPHGLGYYIASRILWDVNEAQNVDALRADFLEKSFGPAKKSMDKFYSLIDGDNKPLFSEDLIGRLYRQLDAALKLTDDPAIRARIMDLALYVRYTELYNEMQHVSKDEHLDAFIKTLRYTWRIREAQMVHSRGVWRALGRYEKVKIPEGHTFRDPIESNPWKSDEPVTEQEILQFISEGIKNNELRDFEIKTFSEELVSASALNLTSGKPGSFNMLRGSQDFYTWIDKVPTTLDLQVRTGLIYTNRGMAHISIYPFSADNGQEGVDALDKKEIEVVPEETDIQLKSNIKGLNRINISDNSAGTRISWAPGTPMTVKSDLDTPTQFSGGRWTMYFYVPKGTKVIGGYRTTPSGSIKSPDGKTALTFTRDGSPGYWSVPIPEGQDGKLWQLFNIGGQVNLMTVPPYLARSAEELLLPKEVIERDK